MIKKFIMRIKYFLSKKRGQGLVEYALIIGVVAMILITLVGSIGKSAFEFISSAIDILP
ncbi:MAG: Flp family type IVb pilin [Ruminiclostridium sp.]|nr:Flp family type IVb pilin [Ruminiclostridium sp.]